MAEPSFVLIFDGFSVIKCEHFGFSYCNFFLENAILKWKLALIQKWIVIFEIICNEKHGKWYNLLILLISISQIWTFSCKNLEKIVVYVMPYLKCQPNLKLIIFKLSNCSDSFLLPLVPNYLVDIRENLVQNNVKGGAKHWVLHYLDQIFANFY